MKTIGLIGGTGWVSSADYYRIINEETNRALGGMEFARMILYSFNYGDVVRFNLAGDAEALYNMLRDAAEKLIGAGAECIILGANTMHLYADRLAEEITVPLIHIAVATAAEIRKKNFTKVALLGTRTTMEKDFYKSKLNESGIETVVPEPEDRIFLNDVINKELIMSVFKDESKQRFLNIIDGLAARGAQGVVLGCTEIPLLIKQEDLDLPVFNTTLIHSKAAVGFALQN